MLSSKLNIFILGILLTSCQCKRNRTGHRSKGGSEYQNVIQGNFTQDNTGYYTYDSTVYRARKHPNVTGSSYSVIAISENPNQRNATNGNINIVSDINESTHRKTHHRSANHEPPSHSSERAPRQSKAANNVWINKLFFKSMVDFVPESATNDKCNRQAALYLEHLRNNSLWAVRMHESSTLTLGGVLTGHTNQFGHPNECVETIVPELAVRGRYCLALAEMMPTFPVDVVEDNTDLIQSVWTQIFKNHTELIRHPRSSFRWGVCIPNECNAQDLERSLYKALSRGFRDLGIKLKIKVSPEFCYSNEEWSFPLQGWCLVVLVTCLVILVIWATAWDYINNVDAPASTLSFSRAFSIIYNTQRLCKVDKDEEMTIIYGIKCLTMFTVVIGHKGLILFGNNIRNKERFERNTVNPAYIYFLNGSVVVDTFFVISGYLSAHQLVQHFSRSKNVSFVLIVLDRIVRILPSYGLVISFYVWVLPYLNNGPLWKSVVVREANRCQENWWANVLFINNFVNEDQMCMLQSWFLAVDFQLFLFSFFIIYIIWRWPYTQGWLLGTYLAVAVAIPAAIIYKKQEWSFLIPSVDNLFDPAQVPHFRDLYIKSYARAIPYVIGIMGAFYRRHLRERQFRFSYGRSKLLIFAGVFIGTHIVFLLPFLFVSAHHPYNVWEQVIYAPVHRIIWALAMCHFIVMHNTGGYGVVSMFLGFKAFAPLSRLCYGVYLTHIAIMLCELGSSQASEYFTLISLAQNIFGDLALSLLASFVLNMLVESPLDTFHKKLKRKVLEKLNKAQKAPKFTHRVSITKSADTIRSYIIPEDLIPPQPTYPADNYQLQFTQCRVTSIDFNTSSNPGSRVSI